MSKTPVRRSTLVYVSMQGKMKKMPACMRCCTNCHKKKKKLIEITLVELNQRVCFYELGDDKRGWLWNTQHHKLALFEWVMCHDLWWLPGPLAPPESRRPRRNITARSYSWTTLKKISFPNEQEKKQTNRWIKEHDYYYHCIVIMSNENKTIWDYLLLYTLICGIYIYIFIHCLTCWNDYFDSKLEL